tara:strand:- start:22 stop:663 length:642 start_codon:yes stop_codon:yes gene_type:complete
MDIYISKKCTHCKKLLVVFYNNKYLIPYFNIIDVESVQIPNFITSVPTLVYNDELYFDERMYNLIDNVNQHHLKKNSDHSNIDLSINQQPSTIQPPMGTQSQSNMMDESRTPNLNSERQPALNRGDPNPSKKMEKPVEDNEIMGVCMGEDCLYENINDDDGGTNNSLMGGYCFLDDGYSEKKPDTSNSSSSGEKSNRFDDNAYEQMMKSRGNI